MSYYNMTTAVYVNLVMKIIIVSQTKLPKMWRETRIGTYTQRKQ